MTTCIITGIVCLFIGTVLGFGVAALMVAAADSERNDKAAPLPKDKGGSDDGRC